MEEMSNKYWKMREPSQGGIARFQKMVYKFYQKIFYNFTFLFVCIARVFSKPTLLNLERVVLPRRTPCASLEKRCLLANDWFLSLFLSLYLSDVTT